MSRKIDLFQQNPPPITGAFLVFFSNGDLLFQPYISLRMILPKRLFELFFLCLLTFFYTFSNILFLGKPIFHLLRY